MKYTLALCVFVLAVSAAAHAEQPDCTGDRHLDQCGQLCPIPSTTTIPVTAECPPTVVVDPAPCQPVICRDGGITIVDRCPSPEALIPCNRRKGKVRTGDIVIDGVPYKCPRKGAPRRKLIPESVVNAAR